MNNIYNISSYNNGINYTYSVEEWLDIIDFMYDDFDYTYFKDTTKEFFMLKPFDNLYFEVIKTDESDISIDEFKHYIKIYIRLMKINNLLDI